MSNQQQRNGASAPPDPNAWREHAAPLEGTVIDFTRGCVQLVGHAPLSIHETVITLTIAQLYMLAAQLMSAPHEVARARFVNGELEKFAREPHGG